jgi:hypothetical protein
LHAASARAGAATTTATEAAIPKTMLRNFKFSPPELRMGGRTPRDGPFPAGPLAYGRFDFGIEGITTGSGRDGWLPGGLV